MTDMEDKVEEPEKKAAEAGKKKASAKARGLSSIQILILHIIIIAAIIWAMFGLVLGAKYAPNNDMSPNIRSGDLMFYYRIGKEYKAQDVVILKKNQTEYVGRIVAGPGDSVDITDSEQLVINGNVVSETNIYAQTPRLEGFLEYPVHLSGGEYFVLADARGGSEDSRYYGIVKSGDIKGNVILIIRRDNP